jgi:membrane dipeptidase
MQKYYIIALLFMLFSCKSGSQDATSEASQRPSDPKNQKIVKLDLANMSDEELKKVADSLAQAYIIADGHVDLPYRMNVAGFMLKKEVMDVSVETEGNFDHPKARRGGLDAPFMSIYVPSRYQETGGSKEYADSLIDMTLRLTDEFPKLFAAANSPDDVRNNFRQGLVSLPMGMENGAPVGNDLKNVEYFFKRGIRYITLTHATDNQICDSSYDNARTWNGLSPFGREVVKEMNRVGIMVDISHVSDSAFYQVMEMTDVPAIASHSSCRHFTPGFERNMSDDMIKALAENGGVICINFGSTFLSKESRDKFDAMREHLTNYRADQGLSSDDPEYQAYAKKVATDMGVYEDVNTVVDHIDRVVALTSIDHVGFGSDFDGVGDSLPLGLKDASMYPNVIYELLKRGYTPEDIEKICSTNVFRVWQQALDAAES